MLIVVAKKKSLEIGMGTPRGLYIRKYPSSPPPPGGGNIRKKGERGNEKKKRGKREKEVKAEINTE